MMMSPILLNSLQKFDRFVLGINEEYPKSIIVDEVLVEKGRIQLFSKEHLPEGPATLLFSYKEKKLRGYEFIQVMGTIEKNYLLIEEIDGWDVSAQEFSSYIQQKIPHGSKYLQDYNKKLLQDIIQLNKAFLITANHGMTRVVQIPLTNRDGFICFQLNREDPSRKQLSMNKSCKLVFTEVDNFPAAKSIICDGTAEENNDFYIFHVEKMMYGDQSELESFQVGKQSGLIQDVRKTIHHKLQYWRELIRFQLFLATLSPVLLGALLSKEIDYLLLVYTFIAFLFVQIGFNLLFDYYDHKRQVDSYKIRTTVFSGGRYINNGLAAPGNVLVTGFILIIISSFIGLYLNNIYKGNFILSISLLGGILASAYNGKPFRLSSNGMGEIAIYLLFGPLPMLASFYIQTGELFTFPIGLLLGSIPGIFTVILVLLNDYSDAEADSRAGKNTLVVRLGRPLILQMIKILLITFQFLVIPLIILGNLDPKFMIVLLSSPLLFSIFRHLKIGFDERKMFTLLISHYIIFLLSLITSFVIS